MPGFAVGVFFGEQYLKQDARVVKATSIAYQNHGAGIGKIDRSPPGENVSLEIAQGHGIGRLDPLAMAMFRDSHVGSHGKRSS
jgi:proline racemase